MMRERVLTLNETDDELVAHTLHWSKAPKRSHSLLSIDGNLTQSPTVCPTSAKIAADLQI